MSDQTPENETTAEGVQIADLPGTGDAAFALVMDLVAAEGNGASGAADGAEAGAAAAGDGQPAPAAEGAEAAAGAAAAPEAGDGGGKGVQDAGAAQAGTGEAAAAGADAGAEAGVAAGAERPATWTASADDLIPKLDEALTGLETRTAEGFKETVLEEVRAEFPKYFVALQQHPRELVGAKVPSIQGEGEDTLRDSTDASEWQAAVKTLLAREVEDRVGKKMDESSSYLNTITASIDLFRNNKDLIPGTKDFDVELANRLTALVKPYEIRVDEKLHGYSIPLQPLVDSMRETIKAERAKAPAPAAASPAAGAKKQAAAAGASTPTAAAAAKPEDAPQAGIQSKAGSSGESKEDFSTLFGTLGLPDLVI